MRSNSSRLDTCIDALGLRVGRILDKRNNQNSSKYQANVTESHDKWYGQHQIPLLCLQYVVFHPFFQPEFVDRLFGAEQSLYILSDEWAVM